MTLATTRTFTSAEVCQLAGITYKQIHHWTVRGFLDPDQAHDLDGNSGSGYSRAWTEHEAIRAREMAAMVRAGISHAKAAELVRAGKTAALLIVPLPETLQ